MKIPAGRVDAFIRQPPEEVRAFLLYGPDGGLVRERAERLCRCFVEDLDDPFRVVSLSANTLREEPGHLADEALALCLTGGRRLIRVRLAGETVDAAFKSYFAASGAEAAVVVEAGELASRSPLRKIFETAASGAALPCFQDDSRRLSTFIGECLKAEGVGVDKDALGYLESVLGADRALTRSELKKLALYMDGRGTVTEADARACVGDFGSVTLDGVAIAVGDGDFAALDRALARARAEGSPQSASCGPWAGTWGGSIACRATRRWGNCCRSSVLPCTSP